MLDMSRIDFTGKTLLLTGSNGGIGRETAIQFRAAGANVVMGEHTVDLDHDFATTLDPTGEHVLSFHLEAGSSASNDAFVAAAVAKFGSIDFVVPAAGIYPEQAITEITNEQWDKVMSVNLDAVFYLIRACVPHMNEGGSIVNVASLAGHRGSNRHAHYAASKGGLLALTRSLTWEFGSKVRVNAVSPGIIDTTMTTDLIETRGESLLAQTPLGRFGQASEVASVIAFLCSPAASFVNGETIQINGGLYES